MKSSCFCHLHFAVTESVLQETKDSDKLVVVGRNLGEVTGFIIFFWHKLLLHSENGCMKYRLLQSLSLMPGTQTFDFETSSSTKMYLNWRFVSEKHGKIFSKTFQT